MCSLASYFRTAPSGPSVSEGYSSSGMQIVFGPVELESITNQMQIPMHFHRNVVGGITDILDLIPRHGLRRKTVPLNNEVINTHLL